MGVKRFHLQLAAKRRWQSQLGVNAEQRSTDPSWPISVQPRRWSASTSYSRLKDLP